MSEAREHGLVSVIAVFGSAFGAGFRLLVACGIIHLIMVVIDELDERQVLASAMAN